MSILAEIETILAALGVPSETGVFSAKSPDTYAVVTPLYDDFPLYGDDRPLIQLQAARVSLFTQKNYRRLAAELTSALLDADLCVTDRRYIGHENDTGYHHYAIDTENYYSWGSESNG
jgi:hypothetical protein